MALTDLAHLVQIGLGHVIKNPVFSQDLLRVGYPGRASDAPVRPEISVGAGKLTAICISIDKRLAAGAIWLVRQWRAWVAIFCDRVEAVMSSNDDLVPEPGIVVHLPKLFGGYFLKILDPGVIHGQF